MIFRYDDLTKFEGKWEDAPGYGVQTIAYVIPQTGLPSLRINGDFYRIGDDGTIIAMDYNSLIRWLVDDIHLIKVGSMVGHFQWERLKELGMGDRDSLHPQFQGGDADAAEEGGG